jgi:hypothetical protein
MQVARLRAFGILVEHMGAAGFTHRIQLVLGKIGVA